jgi:hypothetical protein
MIVTLFLFLHLLVINLPLVQIRSDYESATLLEAADIVGHVEESMRTLRDQRHCGLNDLIILQKSQVIVIVEDLIFFKLLQLLILK